jgi:predicted MFS family arabinose efflux permease
METRFTARRRMAIVLALCLSAFLISVDVTIVNVALPTLVRSLGATTTQLQLVVDAYSLVFAALVLAVSTMAAGVILLVLFVLLERRTAHPMLDVGLFRNPRFTAASGSVAISFFALQGFIFLVTQYFQFIKAFSPLGTGLRLLPVATAVAVASAAGTRLAVRAGNKVIVASGLLSFAAGILWTATVSASTSYTTIALQMLAGRTGAPRISQ